MFISFFLWFLFSVSSVCLVICILLRLKKNCELLFPCCCKIISKAPMWAQCWGWLDVPPFYESLVLEQRYDTCLCLCSGVLAYWVNCKIPSDSKNFYVFLSLLCLVHFQVQSQILTPIYVVIGNYHQ